jgi:hypothetical protein
MWATLRRDRLVQIALVATALLALPFALPLVPRETLQHYSTYVGNIPLILLAGAAIQYRLRRTPPAAFLEPVDRGPGPLAVRCLVLWATAPGRPHARQALSWSASAYA